MMKKQFRNYLAFKQFLIVILLLISGIAHAERVIQVPVCSGDATRIIQQAIDSAAHYDGKSVTIKLAATDYHISREKATSHLYYISNTTSVEENPDPTKHIGLWLRDMRNVTIDGCGARLVTHGEMTTFVIDGCENITLRNFTVMAADPSVPEMVVVESRNQTLVARPTEGSRYEIADDGRFYWVGEGWRFSEGIAQIYYPDRDVTYRCNTPLSGLWFVRERDGLLHFRYHGMAPAAKPGDVYQMRHSFRTEVCGFIHHSKNVTIDNCTFNFLGNFGIVGQYSENLTYRRLRCAPPYGSERTCAGFADFVQMSGCKGKISITDSYFEGAHDDPINIHGTHLKVVEYPADRQVKVRFMHGQSYGFDAFFPGDYIEFVDAHTLLCCQSARVKSVERIDNYTLLLTLNKPIAEAVKRLENVSIENVTWTPDVEITHNYFSRTPTRGILVTTRGKVLIADNTFFRIPMSAILVSDDARSWYESGPVRDVTIARNHFYECESPVIAVAPENDRYEGAVHRNVTIEHNRFVLTCDEAVRAHSTDNFTVRGNHFVSPSDSRPTEQSLVKTENCNNTIVAGNTVTR